MNPLNDGERKCVKKSLIRAENKAFALNKVKMDQIGLKMDQKGLKIDRIFCLKKHDLWHLS